MDAAPRTVPHGKAPRVRDPNASSNEQRVRAALLDHWSLVGRLLRHWGVHDDLDDAMQQTFITFAQKIEQVEAGKEKSFLASCAMNIAARHRRRRAQAQARSAEFDDQYPDPAGSPEQTAARRQRLRELDERLSRLSDENRGVFLMYEVEGWTLREIADTLGLPQGTVASRLRRARAAFCGGREDE